MASIPFTVRRNAGDPVASAACVDWALSELATRLSHHGQALREEPGGRSLHVAGAGEPDAARLAAGAGLALPEGPEAFLLAQVEGAFLAIGSDARGLVYAITELADRVRLSPPRRWGEGLPIAERPANRVRSIARCIVSEVEDKGWFRDETFWTEYLTMLATNRFNRFSLTLGIGYDYPYHNHLISDVYFHFPYPWLVDVPGYGVRVAGLPPGEREANLAMLRFIARETKRRGLDFQLGLWTQRYDFDDVPNARHTIEGVTEGMHAAYCRDALAMILAACPEITGLTFRIHVEGGISEGDYGFWRTVFSAVAAAGRPIEINMHAKGLDEATLAVARETGMPISVSPKYLAEHIGLPYHPASIREREYPPPVPVTNREQLSLGSRKFLRQSYGDLLPADRDWGVLYRVWPGSQRILAWGDPVFAAGLGRSGAFGGADGIEWFEPLTFKGRQGSGMAAGRSLYARRDLETDRDWHKFELQYRLWGRFAYCPQTGPDAAARYGEAAWGDAAGTAAAALATASRILPLVTQTHGPSIANNNYWPEIYTNLSVVGMAPVRPYGADMDQPPRFGNASTFDPQLFANARETVAALLDETAGRRYTPLDVASWLEDLAERTEVELVRLKACRDFDRPAVQRLAIDATISAAIGRFFAEKQRAACWAELFLASRLPKARDMTLRRLRRARAAWMQAVQAADGVYKDDLTFGPGIHLRGTWRNRVADLDAEINELVLWRDDDSFRPDRDRGTAQAAAEGLMAHAPVTSASARLRGPAEFTPGEPMTVTLDLSGVPGPAEAILHVRRVNQAERWDSVPMHGAGGLLAATIPAEFTRTSFPLQYYATVLDAGRRLTMAPGFAPSLDNQPYEVVRPKRA